MSYLRNGSFSHNYNYIGFYQQSEKVHIIIPAFENPE